MPRTTEIRIPKFIYDVLVEIAEKEGKTVERVIRDLIMPTIRNIHENNVHEKWEKVKVVVSLPNKDFEISKAVSKKTRFSRSSLFEKILVVNLMVIWRDKHDVRFGWMFRR
jgi:predicted DNA-binding protein